ncbi:hypothetical protein DFS34DRAFT_629523 [Phlyctochytrium arcticum]|nr:hypothetical protein DFS34DRAFT_629523 [Phlyctochytrium arcticum]
MLVQAFLSLLLLESVYAAAACHPDAPDTAWIQYASVNNSFVSIQRASCYHDVAFYYNDALLARAKSEYAWVEPWARQFWGYLLKHFGGCAIPRIYTGTMGTRCENFGAPKPLVLFLFLTQSSLRTLTHSRFDQMDSGKRNNIKIETTSFAEDYIKDKIGHEMGLLSELITHGTWNEWTGRTGSLKFRFTTFTTKLGI